MHYNALIFDFDGTIADTLGEAIRIYNLLARENGFRQMDQDHLAGFRALDTNGLLAQLKIPKRKIPLLLARGRRMLKAKIASLPLIKG
ncbi:MAG: HAD hydrolase-like protein, partial [Akkermansiaceae bacterium]|nr:HAD hydrolase-like protein [Akkermansiaceae bacterium]